MLLRRCLATQVDAGTLLRVARARFEAKEIPDAESSAKWLLEAAISTRGVKADHVVDASAARAFEEMVTRRLNREPVQYIVGDWDFCNLTLRCRAPVLIPRPETECLVERILEYYGNSPPGHFFDIGCGTGAIGLSLLSKWPSSYCHFIDINPAALQLTEENARLHALSDRISTQLMDITLDGRPSEKADMIVSNPPYVPSREMQTLEEELSFEDPNALDGGDDGMEIAKAVVASAALCLRSNGLLWLELDEGHPQAISTWLAEASHGHTRFAGSFSDFQGRDRFAILRRV